MANVWTLFGDLVDDGARPVKQHLIAQNAYGVVLDIGAGQKAPTPSLFTTA
jgi:hypothetical protein